MTNLDSILKSRDITLPTKVHLAKAMVFPVDMYRCERWTIKKAECGVGEDSWESLGLQGDPISLYHKGNQSWIFIGRTYAEAETPILWPPDVKSWLTGKDPDAGKGWAQEENGVTEDKVVWWHHHSMDMNLSKLQETMKDREAWRAAIHGIAKSQTWLSNWTTTILCSNLILQLD